MLTGELRIKADENWAISHNLIANINGISFFTKNLSDTNYTEIFTADNVYIVEKKLSDITEEDCKQLWSQYYNNLINLYNDSIDDDMIFSDDKKLLFTHKKTYINNALDMLNVGMATAYICTRKSAKGTVEQILLIDENINSHSLEIGEIYRYTSYTAKEQKGEEAGSIQGIGYIVVENRMDITETSISPDLSRLPTTKLNDWELVNFY